MKVGLILMNQCITASRGGGGSTGHFTGSTTGPHFDLRNKDNLLLYQKAILIFFYPKSSFTLWTEPTFPVCTFCEAQMLQIQPSWVTSHKNNQGIWFLRTSSVTDLESVPAGTKNSFNGGRKYIQIRKMIAFNISGPQTVRFYDTWFQKEVNEKEKYAFIF